MIISHVFHNFYSQTGNEFLTGDDCSAQGLSVNDPVLKETLLPPERPVDEVGNTEACFWIVPTLYPYTLAAELQSQAVKDLSFSKHVLSKKRAHHRFCMKMPL